MKRDLSRPVLLLTSPVLLTACGTAAPPEKAEPATPVAVERNLHREETPNLGTPFYTCRDEAGDLQLELYFDREIGQGYGTRYIRREGLPVEMYPFSFDGLESGFDEELLNFVRKDAVSSPWADDYMAFVANYEEVWTYDAAGRPTLFRALGDFGDPVFPEPEKAVEIIAISFSYREDGSLYQKSYCHNYRLLCSTGASTEIFYDLRERPIFVESYITHGHLEHYFIYQGESASPVYCLALDFSGVENLCHAEFYPLEPQAAQ